MQVSTIFGIALQNKQHWILLVSVLVVFVPNVTSCWHDINSNFADAWEANIAMCGTLVDNGKIVGGNNVDNVDTWPWLGYLEINGVFQCTAEVIASEWVTIAAHCVQGRTAQQLRLEFAKTISLSNGIVRGVQEIIIHPQYYNTDIPGNDIAILHLSSPLTYSSSVRPVCLQSTDLDESIYDNHCYVVGWGRTLTGGPAAIILQELPVSLVPEATCKAASVIHALIGDSHICATGAANSGICNGDSGGPLMCKFGSTQWVLVGVTSFIVGAASGDGTTICGDTRYPDVFARVSHYSQWITNEIDARGGPN